MIQMECMTCKVLFRDTHHLHLLLRVSDLFNLLHVEFISMPTKKELHKFTIQFGEGHLFLVKTKKTNLRIFCWTFLVSILATA